MSYIEQSVLKSFFSKNSWLTEETNLNDVADIIKQIDNTIFQYTKGKIPTPATAELAIKHLQNIACRLFVWNSTGISGKVEEWEYKRRSKMNDDAMKELRDILEGNLPVILNDGTSLYITADSDNVQFNSVKRIGDILWNSIY